MLVEENYIRTITDNDKVLNQVRERLEGSNTLQEHKKVFKFTDYALRSFSRKLTVHGRFLPGTDTKVWDDYPAADIESFHAIRSFFGKLQAKLFEGIRSGYPTACNLGLFRPEIEFYNKVNFSPNTSIDSDTANTDYCQVYEENKFRKYMFLI